MIASQDQTDQRGITYPPKIVKNCLILFNKNKEMDTLLEH